jgi:GMP synthase (glutamine-hydrolysing)
MKQKLMKKFLIIQHTPSEDAGLICDALAERGLESETVKIWAGAGLVPESVEPYNGMLILGGPMNVEESERFPNLIHEQELIRRAAADGLPVMGICLGAQLIAAAYGARVYQNTRKEVGWSEIALSESAKDDPLFRGIAGRFPVLHWHGQIFDLPEGAVHLASSTLTPNQAFRLSDNIWALQFHLEATGKHVGRWLGERQLA